MPNTRLLVEIALLAWSAFCLPQCGQGTVEACSDDVECSEEPNLFCDLALHRCIVRPCTPDCSGRECGPDPQNCGTSCGTCKLPDLDCNPTTGRCEGCSPDCGVRVCGGVPNGCGESCGNCEDPESCDMANGRCAPNTGTLLFDGTIQASDHRNGKLGSSMAGYGAYSGWYCIPQSDSITTIPAPGRTGYAIKVIARPVDSACGSTNKDQHLQITNIIKGMPTIHKEVWIGWSTMLDSSWQPQGAWEHFGLALTIQSFKLPNTGLYTDIGTSDTSIQVLNNARHSAGHNALPAAEHTKGVWHDWMFHVKWASDNTGYVELFHKTGTNPYKMTYSIYDLATLNPENPNNDFDVRAGLYRGELSKSTQIFYSQGIKVGTKRADVEYPANQNNK